MAETKAMNIEIDLIPRFYILNSKHPNATDSV